MHDLIEKLSRVTIVVMIPVLRTCTCCLLLRQWRITWHWTKLSTTRQRLQLPL